MNKKQNCLELPEFFSVGSFFFGVITTAIMKQMLFSLTPLTFVVFFNVVNRQKHNYQPDLYLQQAEYNEKLYQDLITFSDDYKYKKLELEKLIEEAQQQRLQLESSTKECLSNSQLGSIVTRLNELESCWVELDVKLEESLDKAKISFLINQLNSLSSNQDKLSNDVESQLNKFRESLEHIEDFLESI